MALALGPLLTEVRQEVAARLNMGAQVNISVAAHPLIDSWIRQAARELVLSAPWVILLQRIDIDLVNDQQEYDIPDGFELGRIETITVVDETDPDRPREFVLEPGVRWYERDSLETTSSGTTPLRYEFVNGVIKIYPPADTERWTKLRIEGYFTPDDVRDNDDRIPIDRQAVIMKAEILGKQHFGIGETVTLERQLERYLAQVRGMQTESESIQLGGHFSQKHAFTRRRSMRNTSLKWWQDSLHIY